MLIPAKHTGLGLRQQDETPDSGGGSWIGRLWRNHIRPRLGAIVGLLVGGPLGAILGELIQQGVTVLVEGQRLAQLDSDNVNVELDQYPISPSEETSLIDFIENQLKPTVAALANKVDTVININLQARLISPITADVLQRANEVLQAIAVIRAHNQVILEHGEAKSRIALAYYSENYVRNKVQAVNLVINALEQATIQYVTNNTNSFRLVEKSFTASNTTRIESLQLHWQGKTATGTKKYYKAVSQPTTPDETPVEVVQTTTTTAGTPDVIVNSPSGNNTEITSKPTSLLKIGAIAAIAIVGYKAISSKKKK